MGKLTDEQADQKALSIISNPFYEKRMNWEVLETARRDFERLYKLQREIRKIGSDKYFAEYNETFKRQAGVMRVIKATSPLEDLRDQYAWDFIHTKEEARKYADVIYSHLRITKALNPSLLKGGARKGSGLRPLTSKQNHRLQMAYQALLSAAKQLHRKKGFPSNGDLQSVLKRCGLTKFGFSRQDLILNPAKETSYYPAHLFAKSRIGIARNFLRTAPTA